MIVGSMEKTFTIYFSYSYKEFVKEYEEAGYMSCSDYDITTITCDEENIKEELKNKYFVFLKDKDYVDLDINIFRIDEVKEHKLICSSCGSDDIRIISGMFADLNRCNNCGYEWR